MHGPGYGPPHGKPRSSATVVVLHICFLVITFGTWGLLAWLTMLRIAFMRRRPVDWMLFAACCLVTVGLIAMIGIWGSDPDAETGNGVDVAAILALFAVAVAVTVHYFVADVRHQAGLRRQWESAQRYQGGPAAGPGYGFGPPPQDAGPVPAAPGYGYPPQRPGYGYPPVNPVNPVNPVPAVPPQPAQRPPAAPANGPRIDQVRAELDELSDYLRKGRREQNP
ncbi:hypothetical protein ACIQ9E_24505 [Streptomyces sp. NPDC094448]|uniref:hypothetical protein n=1 Tax=Streptomyces sp. NPDC094448 TaxID=3366063 RepID=UPI0037F2527A